MYYDATLYYNTGFDGLNIPSSPLVLSTAQNTTHDNVWLWQDKEVQYIKLEIDWQDVQNVDYCKVGETFYFVTSLQMISEGVCQLSLLTDFYNTLGGVLGLGLVSGWCRRAHTNNDKIFNNVIPEPFEPTEPLQIRGIDRQIWGESGNSYITSTVDLENIEKKADTYIDDVSGSAVVYVPKIPQVKAGDETVFEILTFRARNKRERTERQTGKIYSQKIANTKLFRLEDVADAVQTVRSLGITDAITGCYNVPPYFAQFNKIDNKISGQFTGVNVKNIAEIYSTATNNKVYSQYNEVTLVAIATGDSFSSPFYKLRQGDGSLTVMTATDPAPNGRAYHQFKYYNGVEQPLFQNAVKGGRWLNTPIVYGTVEGGAIQQKQFAERQTLVTSKEITNLVAGGVSDILKFDLGGLATRGANALYTGLQLQQEAREFERRQTIVTPQITFPQAPSIQAYMGNGYLVYRVGLSDTDVKKFDKFLTMYGYAQNKELEISDFNNRQYFNYIQAEGVHLKNNKGIRLNNGCIAQLSTGCRLWHVLPNKNYYNNNPIKGGEGH